MKAPGVHVSLAPLSDFDVGGVLAAIVAIVALRAHTLTPLGALAAFAVGTIAFGALGGAGAAVLLAFFVTSVGLSRVGKARKRELVDIGKLGPRDSAQVLANGGIAAACALAAWHFGEARLATAFAGAFAAATADTWGTEIGTLVRQPPRSIFTFKPVATGLSGGVTAAGSLAEVLGACFIAAVASAAGLHHPVAIAAGGVAGALADSLLGGSVQNLRFCPQCRRGCETDPHVCGATTDHLRGWSFVGNDAVNLAATLAGAALAYALAR